MQAAVGARVVWRLAGVYPSGRGALQGGAWCASAAAARLCARRTFGDAHAKLEEMNGAWRVV